MPLRIRYSWKEIDCAIHLLASEMHKHFGDKLKEYYLVPICRGGLIPCGILSHLVPCPVRGAIRVSTYGNNTTPGVPKITEDVHIPTTLCPRIIFVDDIIDSGSTIKALSYYYPQARFVTPLGKSEGLSHIPKHLVPILPPILVGNDDWIEFPWDSEIKPRDKKEGPHG